MCGGVTAGARGDGWFLFRWQGGTAENHGRVEPPSFVSCAEAVVFWLVRGRDCGFLDPHFPCLQLIGTGSAQLHSLSHSELPSATLLFSTSMSSKNLEDSEATTTALMHRRHVISGLGLVGVSMLAAPGDAFAAPKVSVPTSCGGASGMKETSPLASVSKEWAQKNGRDANVYLRYLQGLRLKRVDPEQVISAHAKKRSEIWNTLPPRQWWNRMGYVLRVVDRIALEMNLDEIEVVSAYRTPAYNSLCGGKSRSWHQANVAADVKSSVSAYKFTRVARQLRNEGLFRGGVGGYWGFTHVDARGQNVNW